MSQKRPLLDLVNEVSDAIDTDGVNAIGDTDESLQIAGFIKQAYYTMIGTRDWPHLRRGVTLTASGDVAKPTHMSIADSITTLETLNYDKAKVTDTRKKYGPVVFLESDQFLMKLNSYDDTKSQYTLVQDPSGIELIIRNDVAPTWYTSFDDLNIVFDAYDSAVETTLTSSKTQAIGQIVPVWSMTDTFVPDLPENGFAGLLEESISVASFRLRQRVDQKAEQAASRNSRWLSRNAKKIKGGIKYPDYGRKRKGFTDVTLRSDD